MKAPRRLRPLLAAPLVLASTLTLQAAPTGAQRPLPQTGGPRERPPAGATMRELPPFAPATPAPLTLPPVSNAAAPAGPASGLRFRVNAFRFEGNTVFSAEALALLTAPYAGQALTSEDLARLQQELTRHYIDHGYLNSGAVIPDQQINDGIVTIRLIEGSLTDIDISGNRRLREAYIAGRLRRGAGPPLNVGALQEQLQILLSGPFLARINAELSPGDAPGEAKLTARVEEKRGYDLSLGTNNDITPSLGEIRGVLQAALYSPTGLGDVLATELGYAEGSREAGLNYTVPLNHAGTSLDLYADWSNGEVVEERLAGLNIEGETTSFGARLSHTLRETARERLGLALGFDSRHSTTSLLGRGFAFSPGVETDGDTQVNVLRFAQDWSLRSDRQVIALRSTFSIGLDVFGATHNPHNIPDGQFVAWLGQAQWARRLPWRASQLVFRLDGQWAEDPLLPLEQFSVGGGRTVRGYAKNLLVRDHGFATSLELRVPIWKHASGRSLLEFAPFVDAGGAWFKDREAPAPEIIPALGFGLRSDPLPQVHAELYWGHAFEDIAGKGDSPQEDGIYFTLSVLPFR